MEEKIKPGDVVIILGIGHNFNNSSFPKGEMFTVSNVSKRDDNCWVGKSLIQGRVNGTCTSYKGVRKATQEEINNYLGIPSESINYEIY